LNNSVLNNGDLPTEDFHLISSCPCWAYTSQASGTITCGLPSLCSVF